MKYSRTLLAFSMALACAATSARALDWPQWRGPDRTDVSKETGLLESWPAGGPKRLWLYENAGAGYAGPAIVAGKLFTMGTRDGAEILIALDANLGKELWYARIAELFKESRGDGPRSTPTVDGDQVYAMSGQGNLVCASTADGRILWQQSMTDLGGKRPQWGYTESPLVDGDQVVCTPGGNKGALAAFDKNSGKLRWQSADFTDVAHYSSIISENVNGASQYVQLTSQSIVGIAPKDGKVLWKTSFPGRVAVIPTPIHRDGQVYVTAGYGVGCKSVKIGPNNQVSTLYENKVMKNHHGGVVLVGDYLYGHADPGWVCQNFKSGEEVWNHRGFGKGAIAYADGMLYCLDEGSGTVVLAVTMQLKKRHRLGTDWW
jgi:outer membrane protein assembly factor BamB